MRKTIAIAAWLWLGGAVLGLASHGTPREGVQEAAAGEQTPERTAPAQVEVEIVLSRYRGEERVANLPYTLRLSEGRDKRARLRVGVEVPVEVTSGAIQYRNVGTFIDCSAAATSGPHEAGRGGSHELTLSVEHSVVIPSSSEAEAPFEGAPMFSTFKIESTLELRDGETAELVGSTDPVTGEVMRIRVTLRVG